MIIQDATDLTPMISYAQNFEDVMLRRALADVERGFYIDIGAFDPVADSVTKWFYDCGWHGVNIEPNPTFFARLRTTRIHDTNLNFAVADQEGDVELHLLDGLSTIDATIAERHAQNGVVVGPTFLVKAFPLSKILAEHVGDQTIDFLKIDVEGLEGAIIRSTDFTIVRPRIVVVESTLPNSTDQTWDEWEGHLLGCGYLFSYFDGLNRYYVRHEDQWRMQRLVVPPNVFDRFRLPASSDRVTFESDYHGQIPSLPRSGLAGLLDQRDGLARALEAKMAEVAREQARRRAAEALVSRFNDSLRGDAPLIARDAVLASAEAPSKSMGSTVDEPAGLADPSPDMTDPGKSLNEDDRDGREMWSPWQELWHSALARQERNTRRAMGERDSVRQELRDISARMSAEIAGCRDENRSCVDEVRRAAANRATEAVQHREALNAADARIAGLQHSIDALTGDIDGLRTSATKAEDERVRSALAIQDLQGVLDVAQAEAQALDKDLRALTITHQKMHDELEQTSALASRLDRELNDVVEARDQILIDLWRQRISAKRAVARKLATDADLVRKDADLSFTTTALNGLLQCIEGPLQREGQHPSQTAARDLRITLALSHVAELHSDRARLQSLEQSLGWRLLHPFARPAETSH